MEIIDAPLSPDYPGLEIVLTHGSKVSGFLLRDGTYFFGFIKGDNKTAIRLSEEAVFAMVRLVNDLRPNA